MPLLPPAPFLAIAAPDWYRRRIFIEIDKFLMLKINTIKNYLSGTALAAAQDVVRLTHKQVRLKHPLRRTYAGSEKSSATRFTGKGTTTTLFPGATGALPDLPLDADVVAGIPQP
jgi:hypothetical protein